MAARADRQLGAVVVGSGFGCFTHVRALRGAGFEVRAGRTRPGEDERAGPPLRRLARPPLALGCARPAGRRRRHDRDAAAHARRAGARGARSGQARDLREALRTRHRRGSPPVWIADRSGTRRVPVPDELRPAAPDPPPRDLLRSAFEQMTAHGLDLAPYTRLCRSFRDRILGRPLAAELRPATFADGLAGMCVLDAIRESAAKGGAWTSIA